ncbi:ATP-binding cassette domain-containing protein [Kineococcus sp. SYSU DK004]|uniref:ATP-binding cassette domain-containing protein n=1 Tax=Kineococcus sp. SYSU DK004 TaxID=3383125 RepID=UPI003D7D0FC5
MSGRHLAGASPAPPEDAPDGSPAGPPDDSPSGGADGGAVPTAVRGRGLALRGGRPATGFEGVDVEAPAGALVVVRGGTGSGKTALLLALAGRLRLDAGRLDVLGHSLPGGASAVRRAVALGGVRGVDDLDDVLTVGQHVAERLVLHQPWWRPWATRAAVEDRLAHLRGLLGEQAPALDADALVGDLPPLDRALLAAGLGLLGRPEALAVDDVDALRRAADRRRAWAALAALRTATGRPLTVLATCTDSTDLPADTPGPVVVVDLEDPR